MGVPGQHRRRRKPTGEGLRFTNASLPFHGRPLLCPGDIAGQGTCADSPHTAADDGDGSEKQERLSFRGRGHGATLVIVRAGAITRATPASSR